MSNAAEKIVRGVLRPAGAAVRRIDREVKGAKAGAEAGPSEGVAFVMGTVVAKEGASFVVRAGEQELKAARAVSCLLDPDVGDRVLCAAQGDERYVMSVLKREGSAPSRLTAPGDLSISTPSGGFSVVSKEGIDMATAKEARVVAGSFLLRAAEGSVFVDRLSALGSALRAEVSKIKVVAEQYDSILERAYQRVKRSYRMVEEIDQVRAGQIDMSAKATVRVHAENAVLTANELIKMDGEQIHIG